MSVQEAFMNSGDNAAAGAAAAGAFGAIIIVYAIIIALALVVYWKIVSKAGYPGWYSLGMLVPCVNLVLLIMFAFTDWPIEKELQRLRGMPQGSYPRYPNDPVP
jgi:hypothetical protein